jgi:hypothetical protein
MFADTGQAGRLPIWAGQAVRNERGQRVVGYEAIVSPGLMAVPARVIGAIEKLGAST